MNFDLTKLITNQVDYLEINVEVTLDDDYLKNSSIRELKNTMFMGTITKLYNGEFQIEGTLQGTMILPDDITLEDVEYDFKSDIIEKFSEFNENLDNNLKIIQNRLDITEFLWQNILVEIPLKVVSQKNQNMTLQGDGWRLITEDELKTSNNSPFSELANKFNSRKE